MGNNEFVVKDSGKRESFSGGMVRDTAEGKVDFTYCLQGPLLERWANHMEKGAVKYDRDNWMKAEGEKEYRRFQSSALRHLVQYLRGDKDEDHAAAVVFNLNGAEYVKGKIDSSVEVGNNTAYLYPDGKGGFLPPNADPLSADIASLNLRVGR